MAALILCPPRRLPPAAPGTAPPPRDAGPYFRRDAATSHAHWPSLPSLLASVSIPNRISGLGPGPPWGGGYLASQSRTTGAGRGRTGRAQLSSTLPVGETEVRCAPRLGYARGSGEAGLKLKVWVCLGCMTKFDDEFHDHV